jgi:hypothetical protein
MKNTIEIPYRSIWIPKWGLSGIEKALHVKPGSWFGIGGGEAEPRDVATAIDVQQAIIPA